MIQIPTETVYLGHDNSIDLILKSDDVAQSLVSVTKATINVGGVTVESVNGNTDPIRWAKDGYETGEIRLFLGGQSLIPSTIAQTSYLVIYDSDNPNGIVWGEFLIKVIAEVEH